MHSLSHGALQHFWHITRVHYGCGIQDLKSRGEADPQQGARSTGQVPAVMCSAAAARWGSTFAEAQAMSESRWRLVGSFTIVENAQEAQLCTAATRFVQLGCSAPHDPQRSIISSEPTPESTPGLPWRGCARRTAETISESWRGQQLSRSSQARRPGAASAASQGPAAACWGPACRRTGILNWAAGPRHTWW